MEAAEQQGGHGYIHKSSAHDDLFPAIEAVLAGERFVSSNLEFSVGAKARLPHHHEVLFCSSDVEERGSVPTKRLNLTPPE